MMSHGDPRSPRSDNVRGIMISCPRRFSPYFLPGVFILLATACSDSPTSLAKPRARSALLEPVSVRVVPNRARDASVEGEFAKLDAAYSGFTGMYTDATGAVIANFVSGADTAALRGAIRAYLASSRKANRQLIYHAVKYRYAQLRAWHDVLPQLHDVGLVMANLDVPGDQVWFGAEDAAALNRISAALHSAGVPDDAVRGEVRQRAVPLTDLTDIVRPVVAGLQFTDDAARNICTIGVNIKYPDSSGTYFISAAHCSLNKFQVDGDTALQPYFNTADTSYGHIAREVADPDLFVDAPNCDPG